MKPHSPCKDCPDRQLGCHGKCDKYKDFKEMSIHYSNQLGKAYGAIGYFYEKAKQNAEKSRKKKR